MHQVAVREVTNQIVNMLTNNILEDNGTESFEGWCENGEVFNDHPSYKKECVALMKEVAPIVDNLTYNYLNFGY
jgi:hypothetical protein